jgi:hypothetical protein
MEGFQAEDRTQPIAPYSAIYYGAEVSLRGYRIPVRWDCG